MSFKQAAPNAAGWQQSGQPAMPDPWQQGQPTQPDFQQHMRNPQAMDYFRTNQFAFERGMMGPPPLPQKHVPGYGIVGSPYPTPQPMGVRTAHPGPTNEGVVLPHSQNDQPLAYAKQPAPAINTGDTFNNFPQVNPMPNTMHVNSDKSASAMTKTAMPPAPNRISETRRDANVDIRSNDQRDLKSVMLADKRATLRATELLNANKRNAMNPNPTQRPFPEFTENQTNTPRLPLSSMANTHRPTDIQSVLATYLSNNETSSDSVPSNDSNSPFTPAPQQPVTATPTSAADSGTGAPLPDLNRMFPSLPSSQRPSNSHDAAEDDKDKPKRRRRKRCGTCGPCQVKEDCGECYVCKNKGQVNAICKSRKCLLLRKKAGGSDCGSLTGEGPPNGRFTSAQDLNIPATHKPQSFDPSATPSPLTDCKALLTQMFSSNSVGQPTVNPVSSTAAPTPQQINNTQQNGLDGQMRTQTNSTNDLSVFQRPQQPAAVRNDAPGSTSPDELVRHSTNDQHTAYRKNGPSAWSGPGQGQRPALPWEIGMSKDAHHHRAVGGVGRGGKTLSGAHRPESNSKLNDLYSTFKDDMQRMNERTYFRANGVKVCKVLSKLLDLRITDEEFRSSQPPKPSPNAWEQFLPDSKFMDGQPIGSADNEALGSANSQADGGETRSGQEPVPREVVKYRLSDPETHNSVNSHGTASDVEADTMAEGAPNMDTQAVDSGFSSSSPADRQSPSPKARFGLQTSLSDSTDAQRTGAESQPFTCSPNNCTSTQPISAPTQDQQSNTSSTSAAPSGGKSTGEDILDLSSNSASFPRMDAMHLQGPTNVTQSPVVPSTQTLQMFQQVAGAEGHQPVAESVNGILNALTAKITGSEQIKMEEPTKMESAVMDPANLIKHNKVAEPPNCGCVNRPYDEHIEGPYYIHLGCANSIKNIRTLIEERTGYVGDSIRIEKVRYTTKEGRTSLGCPAAKWILRRSSVDEKVLVVTKHRPGHYCGNAWIIIAIVVWEGVPSVAANHMYDYLTRTLPVYGYETERRCGTNQPRDCACQGWDMNRKGASFSFGCSWSVYYNGCKFARSHIPRKFKLRDESFEGVMESKFQALGQHLAPLYKQMAPLSYGAQVRYEAKAGDCRIGFRTGRPFSGCTATVDFCAHQHRDTHNMNNGCTVVVTLTKHRGLSKPEDEQLHTLPMYCLEGTDEHGSAQVIQQRVEAGSIEILHAFTQEQRRRSKPYKKRKKGTETYQSPKVKLAMMESIRDKMIKDSKDPNKKQTSAQMVPLPQDREMAKQDLFKCNEKSSPPSQPHNMSATPQMAQFLAEKQLQQAGHTLPPPPVPQQGPAPPNPLVTTPSAGVEGAQLKGMEDRVRQHIMHAQLQAQQMGQQPQSQSQTQSQPMDTLQSTREPVREINSMAKPSDSLAEVDVNDEQLNPPKPRPPSPEYDDPEGKEVHEDNTHLFRDPDVGGVALALSHGAVLFEVAKRELHATTALRQPDRYNPTRISLVFYQHKRLNYKKHGFHEYQKAEEERQKARKAAKAAGVEYIPKGLKYKQKRMQEAALRKNRTTNSTEVPMTKFAGIRKKPGKKVGWKQKKQLRFAAYQYLWPRVVNHPGSLTTNSVVTNWVKGKCITTGPYQKWISLHTPPVSVQTPKLSNLTSTSLPTQMSIANLTTATMTSTVNSFVKTSTQAFNPGTVHSSVITTDNSSINMPVVPQNVVKNNIDSSTRHLMSSNASSNPSVGANTPPQFPPSAPNGPNLAAPNTAVNFNPPFSMVKNEGNFTRNPHIPEVVSFAQRPPTFYGT